MMTPSPTAADAVRFLILAAPRTGSNLLCGLLNSHPSILCHHGLFNPDGVHYALDHRDGRLDFGSREKRDLDPAIFLDRVWRNTLGSEAVGFKFNHGESDWALQLLIRDPLVRKIVLTRGNRVRAYVSALEAAATGQWESFGAADGLGAGGPFTSISPASGTTFTRRTNSTLRSAKVFPPQGNLSCRSTMSRLARRRRWAGSCGSWMCVRAD